MALTMPSFGRAPFGSTPAGQFNFTPPETVLYWEDFPKRMRAGQPDPLLPARRRRAHRPAGAQRHRLACPYTGDGQHWHLAIDGDTATDIAWSLPDPLGEADQVTDHYCFYPTKVDVTVDGHHLDA
ncbi:MAG: DUF427 domain-containing protein [Actinobacteria bacterium]|nr:DUF427 domain-containing protein [Actinomycetota bacterium]